MEIRALEPRDIKELRGIHEKFYKEEFEFPDFFKKFLCAFVVLDNERIVSGGGVRLIPEVVLVTDQEVTARKRITALNEVLLASKFIAGKAGFDQIHAFIQDDNWLNILKKSQFQTCRGQAVYTNVE